MTAGLVKYFSKNILIPIKFLQYFLNAQQKKITEFYLKYYLIGSIGLLDFKYLYLDPILKKIKNRKFLISIHKYYKA